MTAEPHGGKTSVMCQFQLSMIPNYHVLNNRITTRLTGVRGHVTTGKVLIVLWRCTPGKYVVSRRQLEKHHRLGYGRTALNWMWPLSPMKQRTCSVTCLLTSIVGGH